MAHLLTKMAFDFVPRWAQAKFQWSRLGWSILLSHGRNKLGSMDTNTDSNTDPDTDIEHGICQKNKNTDTERTRKKYKYKYIFLYN